MTDPCPSCGWTAPKRLTATTEGVTVWVRDKGETAEVLLRPRHPFLNKEASTSFQEGWIRLSLLRWRAVRDTIDDYFLALERGT